MEPAVRKIGIGGISSTKGRGRVGSVDARPGTSAEAIAAPRPAVLPGAFLAGVFVLAVFAGVAVLTPTGRARARPSLVVATESTPGVRRGTEAVAGTAELAEHVGVIDGVQEVDIDMAITLSGWDGGGRGGPHAS